MSCCRSAGGLPRRSSATGRCASTRSSRGGAASGLTGLLPEYIEDGYAEMLAGGLSAGTIVKIHAILSSAYEIEVRRGNVARNPCRLVEPPRLPQPDKGALSTSQARAVLAAAKERRNVAGCGRARSSGCAGRSWTSTCRTASRERCGSGTSCSGCRGGTAAATRPRARSAGTSGHALSGARRPRGSPAAGTSAPSLAPRAFARLTAPGTRLSARTGRAEGWCSARSRNAAARRYRCHPRS